MFELPSLWKEIANIIGAELAGTIYSYYQIFKIALICANTILVGLTIMVPKQSESCFAITKKQKRN